MSVNFIKLSPGKTNSYLISCQKGYLLIDTGYETDYHDFLKELHNKEIKLKDINYLLLTHHHDDHVGFVNELLKDCDLKIITHISAEKLLKTGENDKTKGGGIINKRMYLVFKFGQWFIPNLFGLSFPPVLLRDKDITVRGDNQNVLRNIGINGEILYTPGHTVDSISVLLADGSIFCGDVAANFPDWLGTKYCSPFLTDVKKNYKSWEKILRRGAKTAYPSHGRPFSIEQLKANLNEYNNNSLIRFF